MRSILTILLLLLLLMGGFFLYQNHQQNKQLGRENFDIVMNEKIELLYSQAKDWKNPIKLDLKDERLDGDYKVMSEFILKYWIDNIEARNSYLRELERADWDHFLNLKRLQQDRSQNYKQTQIMLTTVRELITKLKAKNNQITEQALADIEKLNISKSLADSMIQKLQFNQNSNNQTALLQIESEILDRAEQMFELLKNRKWLIKDHMILFEKDADVRQFNLLYTEINNFQQEIEVLTQQNASVFESDESDRVSGESKKAETQGR